MFIVAFLDNSYMYSIVLKDAIYINNKLEQFFGMPELIERLHQIYIKSMKITKNFKIQICVIPSRVTVLFPLFVMAF